MPDRLSIFLQIILPQHFLTACFGWLARIRMDAAKNWMIRKFIRKYQVDMSLACLENPESYPDFNHFFIRKLKPALRPIAAGEDIIVSPVDGKVAQIGLISKDQLLQAKNFYYDLKSLLGNDEELASLFYNGAYTTLYLAPRDYHRVHMPLAGTLKKSIFIPGKLFSVNRMTSEIIPNLFSRNERLVTIFDTEAGPMAVILVGAIIVGNIQTVWMQKPARAYGVENFMPDTELHLQKGDELGHFTLGSTVIVLFGKGNIAWSSDIQANASLQFGENLGCCTFPGRN
jgi:phosphatidylserine decarboxylase